MSATTSPPAEASAPQGNWPAPLHDKNHFIMVMRNDRYWLVGPFDTHDAAADWGCDPVNNPGDDPRWQTIQLAGPGAPPEIRSPSAGPMEA